MVFGKKRKSNFKKADMGSLAPTTPEEVFEEEIEEPEPVKEEPKERIIVVEKLPTQEVRTTKSKDGTIITFMTIGEALTEIINSE